MKLVRPCAVASVLALLALSAGCVPIYQPLRGLNTPVVIDTQVQNLAGVRLTVHCVPGGMLTPLTAQELCQKVGVVFENQGALVTTIATPGGVEGGLDDPSQAASSAMPETDLDLSDADLSWRFESVRVVLPEDALFGNTMFVGKMLMALDEAGGILSMRYCKGLVMTACVDAMDFYSPIFTHEVVTFKAALNHVGTSSLEVGVKVLAEVPWSGEVRHACTAFVTYVHLGPDLRPRPCPPYTPATAGARRRWEAALARRSQRVERVKALKAMLLNERG